MRCSFSPSTPGLWTCPLFSLQHILCCSHRLPDPGHKSLLTPQPKMWLYNLLGSVVFLTTVSHIVWSLLAVLFSSLNCMFIDSFLLAFTDLDSIVKSRDTTLPTKVHLVKAMVFLVVMYGCESCTIRKAEWRRIDTFELWHWRTLLRVPWTSRRSNQSILKEISPEYSLEGLMLMLELKLQYFGHLMGRTDSLEKTLMLGRIEGRRRRRWQRIRWLDDITNVMDMSSGSSGSWWWTGRPGMLWFMELQRVGHAWATELNWTDGI